MYLRITRTSTLVSGSLSSKLPSETSSNRTVSSRLVQAKTRKKTTKDFSHFKLLASIIETEIRQHIEQTSDLSINGIIFFDHVWAIFKPDVEGHE
jgi:hypothetical protein